MTKLLVALLVGFVMLAALAAAAVFSGSAALQFQDQALPITGLTGASQFLVTNAANTALNLIGLSSLGISTNVTTSVSGATNLTPSASFWNTNQDVTMTAAATLTLQAPSFANQTETFKICQNATGGFTVTLSAAGGLTITGTLPTCTTTLSKCCDFELYFDSITTAYVTGFNNSIN